MKDNLLQISEKFYSIQGEGWTTGVPAYFIRLTGCNLSCGIGTKGLINLSKEIKKLSDEEYRAGGYDHKFADLYNKGDATWVCDSASVWLRGKHTEHEELIEDWKKEGIYDWIESRRAHIIWTGGEPTIPKHQDCIVNFLNYIFDKYYIKPFNEIETNGTFYINDLLFDHLDQINCSVKLANSGMSESARIKEKALRRISEHHNHWFKFVINSEKDLEEIHRDFVEPFNLDQGRIIIMPGLDRQEDLFERTNMTLELAKKYGYIGITRLHIAAWGAVTGV